MRHFFKKVHKWLAIPAGIIISFTCLTGAILVFQDEILEFANPSHYFVQEVKAQPISLDKLIPIVNQQLEKNSVESVRISSDPKRTYTMTLSEGFRVSAFVDQYTGKVTGYYKVRESPFFTIMSLHRWLMDGSRTVGKYTVGIATLLFAVILISGAVIWFPKNRKALKSAFSMKLGAGPKRLYFDLHRVLGIYACLLLLICALTGLMWSFEWYQKSVFSVFGAEMPKGEGHGGRGEGKRQKPQVNFNTWQPVAEYLQKQNPENEYIRLSDGKASVHQKYMITSRATDDYVFDKKTAEITETILYEAQPKTTRIWGWVYSLHVGNYWGIWSKILTFVAALIGASLPITGYYLTLKKRKKKAVK